MSELSCLVADDFSSDRFLYAKMLSDLGHEVLAVANNGNELIEKAKQYKPDFILTDINMPVKNGIEASLFIKNKISRDIKIICVTGEDILPNTFEIAKSYINGYVLKGFSLVKLNQAIQCAFAGKFYIDHKLHKKIADLFKLEEIPELFEGLKESADSVIIEQEGFKVKISDRQVLIVSALFYSKSQGEIAEMLSIEPQSVAKNIKRLKERLNATDRMELIRIFMEYGLIDNVQIINPANLK